MKKTTTDNNTESESLKQQDRENPGKSTGAVDRVTPIRSLPQTMALTPAQPARVGYSGPNEWQRRRLAARLEIEERKENQRLQKEASPLRGYDLDLVVGE